MTTRTVPLREIAAGSCSEGQCFSSSGITSLRWKPIWPSCQRCNQKSASMGVVLVETGRGELAIQRR